MANISQILSEGYGEPNAFVEGKIYDLIKAEIIGEDEPETSYNRGFHNEVRVEQRKKLNELFKGRKT